MNKKILLALSIAVVAIAAVGTVSAFDLGALFGFPADQHVTMDGENFTIPGTMKEELNASVNGTEKDYVVFKSLLLPVMLIGNSFHRVHFPIKHQGIYGNSTAVCQVQRCAELMIYDILRVFQLFFRQL